MPMSPTYSSEHLRALSLSKLGHVLNVTARRETSRNAANGRRMTKPPKKKPGSSRKSNIPNIADRGFINGQESTHSRGAIALSTGLLSNVPYSQATASNIFGIGTQHPFANYWTCEGGLPEVISVLPEKIQADILLSRYFDVVDPVYPMIHRQSFYATYEHFWQLSLGDKNTEEADFVALIFVMLALGTQFVTSTSARERKQTAEFYASASNQALRMSSYLSKASTRSVQAMVLLTYFLINDNHASDGWSFAGILMRQAYAMGLHRDPNIGMFCSCSSNCVALPGSNTCNSSNTDCHRFREAAAAKAVAGRAAPRYFPHRAPISATVSHAHGCVGGRLGR